MLPPGPPPVVDINLGSEPPLATQQTVTHTSELVDLSGIETMSEEDVKVYIGERIYNIIEKTYGESHAPKITGMIIDMELESLFHTIETQESLITRCSEAYNLLMSHPDGE